MTAAYIDESMRPMRTGWRDRLPGRLFDLDLAQPLAFAALAVAYLLSRAPYIGISYGTDPDAWRIALSGHWLWEQGEFYPSRLPGYPIPELAYASVVNGGPTATNALTVLVSLVGLWFFAAIVRELELPNRGLLVAAFAFTPLLWINSMTTMDYMWALTFTMASYWALLRRNGFLAALLLGLAVGSRSTSVIMLVPFCVYLWRDHAAGEIRPFIVTVLSVAILAWIPVYWKYGTDFLNFYDTDVGYLNVLRLLGKDCLGLLGAGGVVAASVISLPALAKLPRDVLRDRQVCTWVLAIAVTVISFLRLPHEAAYLIPLYPFGFLLMARYFRTPVLAGALALIVLAGFVDLTSPGDEINSEAFTNAQIGRGLVLSNAETMRTQLDFVDGIERLDVPDSTVVSLGFIYPQFAVRNRDRLTLGMIRRDNDSISQLSDLGKAEDPARRIIYVWLLDYDDFEEYRREGYQFMYTLDAGRSTQALYGYRPALYGAKLIDLGRGPSGGAGAARTDR